MFGSVRPAGAATLILGLLASAPSYGQSFWTGRSIGDGITLEVVRPDLKDVELTSPSLAYYISLRHALSPAVRLVGELPFSYVGFEDEALDEDHGGMLIGNPYLGAEYTPESFFSLEAGFRLPLTDDSKWRMLGMYGGIDRIDAFQDVTPIYSRANFRWALPDSRVAVRLNAGPSVWLQSGDDPDVLLGYGGQLWYQGGSFEIGTGLSGLFIATTSGSVGERSWHQLGFSADVVSGSVRPGVNLRLPIGENMNDVLTYSLGLHVTIPARR